MSENPNPNNGPAGELVFTENVIFWGTVTFANPIVQACQPFLNLCRFSSDTTPAYLIGKKSRGTSGAPLPVLVGDDVIAFRGEVRTPDGLLTPLFPKTGYRVAGVFAPNQATVDFVAQSGGTGAAQDVIVGEVVGAIDFPDQPNVRAGLINPIVLPGPGAVIIPWETVGDYPQTYQGNDIFQLLIDPTLFRDISAYPTKHTYLMNSSFLVESLTAPGVTFSIELLFTPFSTGVPVTALATAHALPLGTTSIQMHGQFQSAPGDTWQVRINAGALVTVNPAPNPFPGVFTSAAFIKIA